MDVDRASLAAMVVSDIVTSIILQLLAVKIEVDVQARWSASSPIDVYSDSGPSDDRFSQLVPSKKLFLFPLHVYSLRLVSPICVHQSN